MERIETERKLIEYIDSGKKVSVVARVFVRVDEDGVIVEANANYPELVGQFVVGFKEVSQ